jgi:hypothetical protein
MKKVCLGAGAVVLFTAMMVAVGMAAKPTSTPIRIWIADQASATTPGLSSDGQGSNQPTEYVDHRLVGGDPCATGTASEGYTVFYPDIKNSDGTFCNDVTPPPTPRYYRFTFPSGASSGGPFGDPTGPCHLLGLTVTWNTDGSAGTCGTTSLVNGYERIIFNNLYASGTSAVALRMALDLPGQLCGDGRCTSMLSLQTDGAASVTTVDAATRIVSYQGTAKLYPVIPRFSGAWTSSFSFPITITVQKG